jgi:beta-hydroxylase
MTNNIDDRYYLLGGNKNNYEPINMKFYDTLILYPELNIFRENYNIIYNELINYLNNYKKWDSWGEIVSYHKDTNWNIIPIYGFNKFSSYSKYFPEIIKLFKKVGNIELLCFSKLCKKTILNIHQGWAKTSNISIRTQLGIDVPENCGIWVEGEKKELKNNIFISFDDSKFHSAYNNSDEDRIVLIFDMKRPEFIKNGNSKVEEVEKMLEYILKI